MKMAASVVRTKSDSPKIDCAGVEAGANILVGLAKEPVGLARRDAGCHRTNAQLNHLACVPRLIGNNLQAEFVSGYALRCPEGDANKLTGFAAHNWPRPWSGVVGRTPCRVVVARDIKKPA